MMLTLSNQPEAAWTIGTISHNWSRNSTNGDFDKVIANRNSSALGFETEYLGTTEEWWWAVEGPSEETYAQYRPWFQFINAETRVGLANILTPLTIDADNPTAGLDGVFGLVLSSTTAAYPPRMAIRPYSGINRTASIDFGQTSKNYRIGTDPASADVQRFVIQNFGSGGAIILDAVGNVVSIPLLGGTSAGTVTFTGTLNGASTTVLSGSFGGNPVFSGSDIRFPNQTLNDASDVATRSLADARYSRKSYNRLGTHFARNTNGASALTQVQNGIQAADAANTTLSDALNPQTWAGETVKIGAVVIAGGSSGGNYAFRSWFSSGTGSLSNVVWSDIAPGSTTFISGSTTVFTGTAPTVSGNATLYQTSNISIPSNVTSLYFHFDFRRTDGGDTNTDTAVISEVRVDEQ
jgi:hypothetical protein